MKKSIMLVLSMFLVFGFVSCSKSKDNKIDGIIQIIVNDTIAVILPTENIMQEDEINIINSTDTLESSEYTISALRFDNKAVTADGQIFIVQNGYNYTLCFEVKNISTEKVLYVNVSEAGNDWTFNSLDNDNIVKYYDSGFTVKNTFYKDKDANIVVNISWKGLTKQFNFVLRSDTDLI